jgi:hypothetical protein
MDINNQRRCLNALTAAMIAGACGGGYWAVSEIDVSAADQVRGGAGTPLVLPIDDDSQESKSPLAMRSLRGPLYDPPTVAQRPPTPAPKPPPTPPPRVESKPRLDLRLVGTIINADRSVAIVSDASGNLDVKGRGETLELSPPGITIDAIDSQAITLSYQGRQSTIELDRTGGTSGGTGGGDAMGRPNGNPMEPPPNPYGSSRANRKRDQ